MSKVLTGITTLLLIFCGIVHYYLGGLRVELNGKTDFSNSLASSGSYDSFLVQLSLYAFSISVVAALANKAFAKCYIVNASLFYGVLLLVNLDVPIVKSIQLGDYVLATAGVLALAPLIHHQTKPSN